MARFRGDVFILVRRPTCDLPVHEVHGNFVHRYTVLMTIKSKSNLFRLYALHTIYYSHSHQSYPLSCSLLGGCDFVNISLPLDIIQSHLRRQS